MLEFLKKDVLEENAKLRGRIAELTNILGSIAAPMVVVDKDLTITSVNDAALKTMGYRRDEVLGKDDVRRFSEDPPVRDVKLYPQELYAYRRGGYRRNRG